MVAGAVIGASFNVAALYLQAAVTGNLPTNEQLLAAAVSGAVSGAVGALAGPLGGSIAKGIFRVASGGAGRGMAATAVAHIATTGLSAIGSGLGQLVGNQFCYTGSALNAMWFGGFGGNVGALVRVPFQTTLKQALRMGVARDLSLKSFKQLYTTASGRLIARAATLSAIFSTGTNFVDWPF